MKSRRTRNRRGAVAALLCLLILPLLALLALSVDYGFLLCVRTDLQRTADHAALAAVRDLVPDENGYQDLDQVRETVREYVQMNLGEDFVVNDSDIEIGRYDPDTVYSSVDLLNNGIYDTVRITIRRDDLANTSVSLCFARLFDRDQSDVFVTATAVLQKARYLGPGTAVLPIGIQDTTWQTMNNGDQISIYGDGRIEDESGNPVPGNWGTMDIGPTSNSTQELSEQIMNGLSQNDLNSLEQQGAIPSSDYIDGASGVSLNADPGLSSGMKHAIESVTGTTMLIPIFGAVSGNGNNAYYEVVGWAGVQLVDSNFQGNSNTYVEVRKVFHFDGALLPNPDLSDDTNTIEGAFTSPGLVE